MSPLVLAFAVVSTHHCASFSSCVIHKKDLCPSSGDINRLMMIILLYTTRANRRIKAATKTRRFYASVSGVLIYVYAGFFHYAPLIKFRINLPVVWTIAKYEYTMRRDEIARSIYFVPVLMFRVNFCDELFGNGTRLKGHYHQPINVPTAGAQAFLVDYT
jgi:hypothetical protein